MKNYKKIHIWEFPPTLTFIRLNEEFRTDLFDKLISKTGSQEKLLLIVNKNSVRYCIKRNHGSGNLYSWIKGEKLDRGTTRKINIPLWFLIEASIILTENNNSNEIMEKIEKNIEFYTSWGKSNPITTPKLPLYLTPELVSIIFHFTGDGHIGRKGVSSSYRQMNKHGLNNFLKKLENSFGNFEYSKNEFENGRLNVPKVITNFYNYYFQLPDTSTFKAYIPNNIKELDKDFLIAGLVSFIVDEGHIDEVITIYSKNKRLLEDIHEIAIICGYLCHPIREKYAYKKFDCYRFNISSKSFTKLAEDINILSSTFPTCDLAQKQHKLVRKNP